jgi:hypothetical protein
MEEDWTLPTRAVLAEAASEPIDESLRILTEAVSNEPQQHLLRTQALLKDFGCNH